MKHKGEMIYNVKNTYEQKQKFSICKRHPGIYRSSMEYIERF